MHWAISDSHGLDDILSALADGRTVYALEGPGGGPYHLVRASGWDPFRHTLGAFRPNEPVKSVLFRPRERITAERRDTQRADGAAGCIVFGVKNCDLSSLAVHDHVFLDSGYTDPHYAGTRRDTLIVSCDCTDFRDTCFCPVVGEQPYARSGFDINIAPTAQGYVLEPGSERGAEALQAAQQYLEPAGDQQLAARDRQRAALYDRLVEHQAEACGLRPGTDLRRAVERAYDSTLWEDFAADCVECGACNFICCTCHCFLLADGVDVHGRPARTKQWDACLFKGFAATAGGNPRALRAQRLHNRFEKKFSFFPERIGRYACDGCGRCTDACIGKIDIRDVLRRAVGEVAA